MDTSIHEKNEKVTKATAESDVLAESGAASLAGQYGIDDKKLIAKLDFRLLPGVSILYLLSFLDRSNVGNAKIAGLTESLQMSGDTYLTGLTLFFVGYILFEVPCNIILKRTTPKFWLPTVTVIWGINCTLLGTISNTAGFWAARFFLGVCEGGLFPGVVYYLSMWYRRRQRQFRIALFFSAASLAGAFGGVLAYGISFMQGVGGYDGWRWIFILEGLFTFLVGLTAYLFICNYPSTAKFLKEDEKAYLQAALKADSDATNDEAFTWGNVGKAIRDPKVWLYCAAFHTMSLPLYTLSLFLPTIIANLGYTAAQAQLLTVPPYALATILTVIIATWSERVNMRAPFVMVTSSFACIGYIILLANTDTKIVTGTDPITGAAIPVPGYVHPGISYVGVFFATAGIYPSTALALSWPAVNVSGQTKRATAGGMQIMIGNLAAVFGTQLYRSEDSPAFTLGHSFCLAYLILNVLVSGFLWWYLKRLNKQRDAVQASQGKGAVDSEEEWSGDDDLRFRFTT